MVFVYAYLKSAPIIFFLYNKNTESTLIINKINTEHLEYQLCSNLPHVGPQAFLGPDLFREDVREGGLQVQKIIVVLSCQRLNCVKICKKPLSCDFPQMVNSTGFHGIFSSLKRNKAVIPPKNYQTYLKPLLGGLPCAKNKVTWHLKS